mmetsp:Transcript_19990/g.37908  ORF Transcript_19990/g.37908 Transcript_19990/m.37908 type:complete len:209 (+) Transcript_19990:287-913(+)
MTRVPQQRSNDPTIDKAYYYSHLRNHQPLLKTLVEAKRNNTWKHQCDKKTGLLLWKTCRVERLPKRPSSMACICDRQSLKNNTMQHCFHKNTRISNYITIKRLGSWFNTFKTKVVVRNLSMSSFWTVRTRPRQRLFSKSTGRIFPKCLSPIGTNPPARCYEKGTGKGIPKMLCTVLLQMPYETNFVTCPLGRTTLTVVGAMSRGYWKW